MSNSEVYSYMLELYGVSESGDILSVTVDKGFVPYEHYDQTTVYFMTDTERIAIKMLMDQGTEDVVVTPIQLPPLSVSTEELVYPAEQNTDLLDIQYTNSTDNLELEITMVNLYNGKATIGSYFDYSNFFDTTISKKHGSSREKQIQGRVRTSAYRISGYINIIANIYLFSNSSAVENVEIRKKVTLRPAGQAGPFPDGYLGFVTVEESNIDEFGMEIHVCNITAENVCKEIVILLSERDFQLTCMEITSNGRIPLPVTPPSELEFYPDVQKHLFTVEPSSASQNSSVVRCTAMNETGFHISKEFLVVYFEQPRILENKSWVQNGTSNVTVVCTASGQPLPNRLYVHAIVKDSEADYPGLRDFWSEVQPDALVASPDGQEVHRTVTISLEPSESLASLTCGLALEHHYRDEQGHLDYVTIARDYWEIF